MLTENTELSDEKIGELVDAFMDALLVMLKTQLQAVQKLNIDNRKTARYVLNFQGV